MVFVIGNAKWCCIEEFLDRYWRTTSDIVEELGVGLESDVVASLVLDEDLSEHLSIS